MKHKIVFCSLLLMIAFADVGVARSLAPDKGVAEGARPSPRKPSVSLAKLGYQNLRDASKWSRLTHGRALTLSLKKKNAHPQDTCLDCGDWMFPSDGSWDPMEIIQDGYVDKSGSVSGSCNWSCCFKICMGSAMAGTGTLCTTNCTACGLTANAWPCAVCVGCGTVGFAAIEFCGLHCCVNPGC